VNPWLTDRPIDWSAQAPVQAHKSGFLGTSATFSIASALPSSRNRQDPLKAG
jgi:hypothetical protein